MVFGGLLALFVAVTGVFERLRSSAVHVVYIPRRDNLCFICCRRCPSSGSDPLQYITTDIEHPAPWVPLLPSQKLINRRLRRLLPIPEFLSLMHYLRPIHILPYFLTFRPNPFS